MMLMATPFRGNCWQIFVQFLFLYFAFCIFCLFPVVLKLRRVEKTRLLFAQKLAI